MTTEVLRVGNLGRVLALMAAVSASEAGATTLYSQAAGFSVGNVEFRQETYQQRIGTFLPYMAFESGTDAGIFFGAGIGMAGQDSNFRYKGDVYIKWEPLTRAQLSAYALFGLSASGVANSCYTTPAYDESQGGYVQQRRCDYFNASGAAAGGGVRFRFQPRTHIFLQYMATVDDPKEVSRSALLGISFR